MGAGFGLKVRYMREVNLCLLFLLKIINKNL
jgi:hypothetical protein